MRSLTIYLPIIPQAENGLSLQMLCGEYGLVEETKSPSNVGLYDYSSKLFYKNCDCI